MATNIKHILNNLEVQPPPGVWPDIAARLNAEYDAEETPVAQKMFDLAVTPPPGIWPHIESELNSELEADEVQVGQKLYELSVAPPYDTWDKIAAQLHHIKKEGKLISLHSSRKAIVAAAAMVLLTVGAWYFLDKTNSSDNTEVARRSTTTSPTKNGSTAPATRANDLEIGEEPSAAQLSQKPIAALSGATDASLLTNRYASRHGIRRTAFYDYQPIATSSADMDDVQAVDFTNTNSPDVEAPLIRDANGQVILDKKLVTSPDDCYINITSPNGEQTRISSKFLHIISTLNQDVEPQDYFDFMMQENSLWKIRFSEWKEKFMNQASYIPTATSFTDILELKDLLMENQ